MEDGFLDWSEKSPIIINNTAAKDLYHPNSPSLQACFHLFSQAVRKPAFFSLCIHILPTKLSPHSCSLPVSFPLPSSPLPHPFSSASPYLGNIPDRCGRRCGRWRGWQEELFWREKWKEIWGRATQTLFSPSLKHSTCWTINKPVKYKRVCAKAQTCTHTHTHSAYALYNKPVWCFGLEANRHSESVTAYNIRMMEMSLSCGVLWLTRELVANIKFLLDMSYSWWHTYMVIASQYVHTYNAFSNLSLCSVGEIL